MKLYFKPIFLIGDGGSGSLIPPGYEGSAPGGDAGGETGGGDSGGDRAFNNVQSLDQVIDVFAVDEPKAEIEPEVMPEVEKMAPDIEVAPVEIPFG